MILSEPMFAVVRIVCSHVRKLRPYSFLLQDDGEEPKWLEKVKGIFK